MNQVYHLRRSIYMNIKHTDDLIFEFRCVLYLEAVIG
jgi:hypothetical protein